MWALSHFCVKRNFQKRGAQALTVLLVLIRDHVIQGVLQRGRGANRHKITKLLKHAAEKSNERNLDRCINIADARKAMETKLETIESCDAFA
jgi:hypothetical protein